MVKRSRESLDDILVISKRSKTATPFHGLLPVAYTPHLVKNDGACFFRAIAHQLYGSQDRHGEIRQGAVNWMRKNRSDFECFFALEARPSRFARKGSCRSANSTEIHSGLDKHLRQMSKTETYATELEIQATAASLQLKIVIHRSDHNVANIIGEGQEVRICYDAVAEHYWSNTVDTKYQGSIETVDDDSSVSSSEVLEVAPAVSRSFVFDNDSEDDDWQPAR